MNNITNIKSYTPSKDDAFFLDANIWIGIFVPIGDYRKRIYEVYSGFLNDLIKLKVKIYISSLILSEIINSYLRLEFNILKCRMPEVYKKFKRDFRCKKEYAKAMSDITDIINRQIMKLANRVNDRFDTINLEDLFNNIENSDFNDNYILNLVKENNFIFVTHDSDFKNSILKIPIITANEKLLVLKK